MKLATGLKLIETGFEVEGGELGREVGRRDWLESCRVMGWEEELEEEEEEELEELEEEEEEVAAGEPEAVVVLTAEGAATDTGAAEVTVDV